MFGWGQRGKVDAEVKEILGAILVELKGVRSDLRGFAESAGRHTGQLTQRVEAVEHGLKVLKAKPTPKRPAVVR